MNKYQVIIVGGGPAGLQCARNLSANGIKVLVLEKVKDFSLNNFSSAGAPINILEDYSIDRNVVAAYWSSIRISSSIKRFEFKGGYLAGVVMDFAKLRNFLKDEIIKNKSDVLMGYSFISKAKIDNKWQITAIDYSTNTKKTFESNLIVDASGPQRAVMGKSKDVKYVNAVGIEYIIEVDSNIYQLYANSLDFHLGSKWAPNGYGWVFPMSNNQLKVGVGVLKVSKTSLDSMVEKIIREYININEYKVIEKHGGTLIYCKGFQDKYYDDGILAIGDAVSTVNPLGGEGIRHALKSGNVAASQILKYINSNNKIYLESYKNILIKGTFLKNFITTWFANKVYYALNDNQISKGVALVSKLCFEDLTDILFNYKYIVLLKVAPKIIQIVLGKIFTKFNLKID